MVTLNDCLKRFYYALDGEIKPKTLRWYKSHLTNLIDPLGDRDVHSITVDDLREWRHTQFNHALRYESHPLRPEEDGPLSIHTKRGRIRALKRFFSWLHDEGIIAQDPSERIKLPPKPKNCEPKAISEDDILELLQVAEHPRDVALLYVFEESGARVGGVVNLQLADVNPDRRVLTVTEKGTKSRFVYLTKEGAAALDEWLDMRPEVNNDFVFISLKRSSPLTSSGVYQVFKRLARKAEVDHFNPHSFRHAFAREMLNAGASLDAVADMMGHANVSTTAENYAIWLQEEIQQKHKKYSKVRKKRRKRHGSDKSNKNKV